MNVINITVAPLQGPGPCDNLFKSSFESVNLSLTVFSCYGLVVELFFTIM